ncbi:TerD family protein [Acidovorax sp. 106]|uniref:TerD family protein n=1 Tax=Acidovorax sp. 106 TaxID=2135637 RepID=UPI000EAE9BAA|nr:TerD family protein [Acidovorax sp. 106]RLJ37398.1 tellurium resistance protein TerD [Acidovorax sp. 106]
MALELKLSKPGDTAPKLSLNLAKPARFTVELSWDSAHDLDTHALLASNGGGGAKVTSFDQVLSTYNAKKTNPQGVLTTNADGSFSTPEGGITHSGDARTGVNLDVDETLSIDGSKIPAGVNEIPIFVTIHAASGANFSSVKNAGIRIKNDQGLVLGEYLLSNEFGPFNAVQMGSLLLDGSGWHYLAAGSGFNGDFNFILSHFS